MTALLPRRRLLAACAVLVPLAFGCTPAAYADTRLVQVEIVDRESGQALHVWRDHGRPVVAGRPGARYAVRLTNRTDERILAVVSIDGVNIVTGETAASGQTGYVLAPRQRTSLTGWRKSNSEVAAFEFTALSDSYAARTGRPDDVGVIGVALFRERVPAWREAPPAVIGDARGDARDTAPAATPGADAGAAAKAPPAPAPRTEASRGAQAESRVAQAPVQPTERLGTGHGAREYSRVVDTDFERLTDAPQEVATLRYDSWDNLAAAGIVPRRTAQALPVARPFPADPAPGFVPDPPSR